MNKEAPQKRSSKSEIKVYGENACQALWQARADAIIRVYVTKDRLKDFGPLLKWCAKHKKAYHVLEPLELEKVAASVHHEGVMILAQDRTFLAETHLLQKLEMIRNASAAIYLDGVKNPHNIGSILRVAAHFGAPFALGRLGELPRLTPAALRVAEGGAEHVELCGLEHPETTLKKLSKAGWPLVATSSHEGTNLYDTSLPKNCIFALGNEVSGMSPKLLKNADFVVKVPGTGAVESLNVAACASILLAEHWRQNHGRKA